MKFTRLEPIQYEVTEVHVRLPVRFGDEDMPYDFPLRVGDVWSAAIEIETGQIKNWPNGITEVSHLHLKVCDEGVYELRGPKGRVAILQDEYVPHGLIPGMYGDYVIFHLSPTGLITNWPSVDCIILEAFNHKYD